MTYPADTTGTPLRLLRNGAIAVLCALAWTPAVLAQEEKVMSTHGDWLVKCGQPPGSKQQICWVEQKVASEDRPNVGLTVTYLNSPKGKDEQGVLQIQAPLGIMLPRGLGLKIDGKDHGNVPFLRCFTDGCLARAHVPDNLMNSFKTGSTAVFIIFDTPESGIGIPISLTGLSAAITALK